MNHFECEILMQLLRSEGEKKKIHQANNLQQYNYCTAYTGSDTCSRITKSKHSAAYSAKISEKAKQYHILWVLSALTEIFNLEGHRVDSTVSSLQALLFQLFICRCEV